MAIVVVHVGQCGNQLGDELFTQLHILLKASEKLPSAFFARDGMARCVLVDSEPKVVQGVSARHAEFIRPENVVGGQSGRGNNWGLGYYGVRDPHCKHPESKESGFNNRDLFVAFRKDQRVADSEFLMKSLRAIHLETWRTLDCENFEAIVLVHSLAGGTGSGFASLLAQKIQYYFIQPSHQDSQSWDEVKEEQAQRSDGLDGMLVEKRRAKYLVCVTVAPQRAGELATQSINAALCLHVLHRCANAIILLRNDDVMTSRDSISSPATPSHCDSIQPCPTFKEANEVFVALLLPLFFYGQTFGSVQALLEQLIFPISEGRKFGMEGAGNRNNILSLVPTPRSNYEAWSHCALRCRFYAVRGGKTFMPGCKPVIPWQKILTPSALAAQLSSEGNKKNSAQPRPQEKANRHSPSRGAVENRARSLKSGARGDTNELCVFPRGGNRRRRCSLSSSEVQSVGLGGKSQNDKSRIIDQGLDTTASEYVEVPVNIPRQLLSYYSTLKASPVAKLLRSFEGVAVLNQTRELNSTLLFSLLSSAALKVKAGAFLHLYEQVGVRGREIEKAYQELAQFLSGAEQS